MNLLNVLVRLPGAKPETMRQIQSALDGSHERRMAFMQSLCHIHQGLLKARNEPAMFDLVCQGLTHLPEVTAAWIAAPAADGATLEPVAGAGISGVDWTDLAIPLGRRDGTDAAPQAQVFRTARPFRLDREDSGADPIRRLLPPAPAGRGGGQTLLCLPVRQDNGPPLGILSLYLPPGGGLPEDAPALLEELADDLGQAVSALRRERRLSDNFQSLGRIFDETVNSLSRIHEFRDPRTSRHQKNVADLACALADTLGASEWVRTGVSILARLHDVGKLLLPPALLNESCILGVRDVEQVKNHPEAGFNILRGIQFPWPVAEAVRQHHERLNGSGYPRGLKENDILWEARLLAVADVTETMTNLNGTAGSPRNLDYALRELSRNRGTLYDAAMVEACIGLLHSGKFVFAPLPAAAR